MHAPTSPSHVKSPLLIHFILRYHSFAFFNRRGEDVSIPNTLTTNCVCQCIPPDHVHYCLVRTVQIVKDLRARKMEGAIVPRLLKNSIK